MGGSPNARIDAVLREEKGFTYGMRATFRPRRRGGLFLVSGSVRADATAEALELLLDILERGRDGFTAPGDPGRRGLHPQDRARTYATADAVADEAAAMALEGLSTEFTTANLLDLATVDADRLAAAYNRFVTGDWTVVVVGDAGRHAEQCGGSAVARSPSSRPDPGTRPAAVPEGAGQLACWYAAGGAQAVTDSSASSRTWRPSSSSSSLMTSGGRKRMTLPYVPQVRTSTPCSWHAWRPRGQLGVRLGRARLDELDRQHAAAAADVADRRALVRDGLQPGLG